MSLISTVDPTTDHEKRILATLAELGAERVPADDGIVREGDRLVLPAHMTPNQGIALLEEHIVLEEEATVFTKEFLYRPNDGAAATMRAIRKVTGTVAQGVAIQTMFGPIPPELKTINVGPGETMQVPQRRVALPIFGKKAHADFRTWNHEEYGTLFALHVQAPRARRQVVEGLFLAVEQELASNSIYRGQAITGQQEPEFLPLDRVSLDRLVYSDEVIALLDAEVWTYLERTELHREMGDRLKRAVVLEGPYGTGKSEGLRVTAKKAVENGWTFILCRPGRDDLHEVMGMAKLYAPCVIGFEDVDVVASGQNDAETTSVMLDLLDGSQVKDQELLVLFTTNHVHKLHKGMLRPGRLDAVIEIGMPGLREVERLIKLSVPPELIHRDVDWNKVYDAVEDYTPAFVREVANKAKNQMIARTKGDMSPLITEDFVFAAGSLRRQFQLMLDAADERTEPTARELFFQLLEEGLAGTPLVTYEGGSTQQIGRKSDVDGRNGGHDKEYELDYPFVPEPSYKD